MQIIFSFLLGELLSVDFILYIKGKFSSICYFSLNLIPTFHQLSKTSCNKCYTQFEWNRSTDPKYVPHLGTDSGVTSSIFEYLQQEIIGIVLLRLLNMNSMHSIFFIFTLVNIIHLSFWFLVILQNTNYCLSSTTSNSSYVF